MFILETTALALSFSSVLDLFGSIDEVPMLTLQSGQFSQPKSVAQVVVIGWHIIVADGLLVCLHRSLVDPCSHQNLTRYTAVGSYGDGTTRE